MGLQSPFARTSPSTSPRRVRDRRAVATAHPHIFPQSLTTPHVVAPPPRQRHPRRSLSPVLTLGRKASAISRRHLSDLTDPFDALGQLIPPIKPHVTAPRRSAAFHTSHTPMRSASPPPPIPPPCLIPRSAPPQPDNSPPRIMSADNLPLHIPSGHRANYPRPESETPPRPVPRLLRRNGTQADFAPIPIRPSRRLAPFLPRG